MKMGMRLKGDAGDEGSRGRCVMEMEGPGDGMSCACGVCPEALGACCPFGGGPAAEGMGFPEGCPLDR